MSALRTGDLVLDSTDSLTMVLVNQHAAQSQAANLIDVHHSDGVLSVTEDHALFFDGAFMPARGVMVGTKLGELSVMKVVGSSRGSVVNPVTTTGTILAAGTTGSPVLAWPSKISQISISRAF